MARGPATTPGAPALILTFPSAALFAVVCGAWHAPALEESSWPTQAADNRLLGQFDLSGIPPAPRGTPQMRG